MWDILPIFPSSAASQQTEIERIKAANPSFVMIDNSPLDGQDDLRFQNTHPIIDQYIRNNYVPIHNLHKSTYDLKMYKSKKSDIETMIDHAK